MGLGWAQLASHRTAVYLGERLAAGGGLGDAGGVHEHADRVCAKVGARPHPLPGGLPVAEVVDLQLDAVPAIVK
jgi:hypothetical protein